MYGITVLSSYAIIMVLATLLLTKRETVAEKFYVGDRRMGTLQSAMSIAATWIWAPALFVSAEKAYANGFVGLFWFLVPNILCLLLFIPFARKIRERMPHGISLAGFMGEQYHSVKVKGIYLFQLGSLSVLSTGVQLLAGGKILSTITGIPMFAMTVILAAIAYSYSQFSGIKASVMTDAVQMIIMLAVCAILIPWALSMPGNTQALARGITGVTGDFTSLFSESGMQVLLGFGIPTAIGLFAGPFGDQCFWQRAFSIQENNIRRAFTLGALLFAIVPLSMGLLGFVAAGKGFTPNDSGMIDQMEPNEEQLLIDEINLLTIRERRIMQRIDKANKDKLAVYGTVRTERKRAFDTPEEKELYLEMVKKKVEKGERLPGQEYTTQTTTEGAYSIILKLEEALTRCQAQKQRAIDSLNKIRQAQGSKGGALTDDWISGVVGSMEMEDDMDD